MAGLINSAITGTQEKDLLAPGKTLQMQGVGYDPEKRGVGSEELVSTQLDKQLGKDSLLQQRARAGAMQTANSRGLLNSTMAAQAGEAAAIDAALPIAGADASTYSLAARENQAAGNTALQFGANATNQASTLNVSNAADIAKLREAGGIESGLVTQKGALESNLLAQKGQLETALQTLKGGQAEMLANIEANYKTLLQASDAAKTLSATNMQLMTAVMSDTTTTPEQKQAGIDRLTDMYRAALAVVGGAAGVDLVGLLDFS